jgi:autotransporter adhesin
LAPGQDNALTVSLGFYDSSSAVALGYAKRINSNTQLFSTVGYGSKTGKVGVSAGLQFNW